MNVVFTEGGNIAIETYRFGQRTLHLNARELVRPAGGDDFWVDLIHGAIHRGQDDQVIDLAIYQAGLNRDARVSEPYLRGLARNLAGLSQAELKQLDEAQFVSQAMLHEWDAFNRIRDAYRAATGLNLSAQSLRDVLKHNTKTRVMVEPEISRVADMAAHITRAHVQEKEYRIYRQRSSIIRDVLFNTELAGPRVQDQLAYVFGYLRRVDDDVEVLPRIFSGEHLRAVPDLARHYAYFQFNGGDGVELLRNIRALLGQSLQMKI